MRIWSLHPQYLDSKGLVALWREALLARNVLAGNTKGYKNHPQLNRFRAAPLPLQAINAYLIEVYNEAVKRDYHFNQQKIDWDVGDCKQITVTQGQLVYEFSHLLVKLKKRDPSLFVKIKDIKLIKQHPLFSLIDGEIADWEVL